MHNLYFTYFTHLCKHKLGLCQFSEFIFVHKEMNALFLNNVKDI